MTARTYRCLVRVLCAVRAGRPTTPPRKTSESKTSESCLSMNTPSCAIGIYPANPQKRHDYRFVLAFLWLDQFFKEKK